MKVKRLKISQQLLIVFLLAVLFPLCITAFIVTNVNQHAVRKELRYSAKITTDSVYQRLIKSFDERKMSVLFIAKSIDYIKNNSNVDKFLSEISRSSSNITNIELIKEDKNITKENKNMLFRKTNVEIFPDLGNGLILMYVTLQNGKYLKKSVNIQEIEKELFKYLVNDERQVYIIDNKNRIIMSYNANVNLFEKIIRDIPRFYKVEEPVIFGQIKNQPNVFLKLKEPDWSIVVITPEDLISYGIIDARFKIVTSIVVAAFAIIVFGVLYSYSLNRNIRQLFKSIVAMAKGNYERKVRLIRDFFTPREVVELFEKFNIMAEKINNSHKDLKEANEQLSKLDKLKSNLIDTVSHEFRTPLTSIRGYTSRLLRNDINIDDETKIKSLKVIKQQTERLGRLVDDLLVVPEIESSLLRIFPDKVNLKEIFEDCIISIKQKASKEIKLEIEDNIPSVYADPDRVVQIIINLLDNAVKYSDENSEINIKVTEEEHFAKIQVKNGCPPISEEKMNSLFEKFSRLDDNLTRTTRGTGLGLYIVRGLVHAMDGEISLSVEDGFEISFTLPLLKD